MAGRSGFFDPVLSAPIGRGTAQSKKEKVALPEEAFFIPPRLGEYLQELLVATIIAQPKDQDLLIFCIEFFQGKLKDEGGSDIRYSKEQTAADMLMKREGPPRPPKVVLVKEPERRPTPPPLTVIERPVASESSFNADSAGNYAGRNALSMETMQNVDAGGLLGQASPGMFGSLGAGRGKSRGQSESHMPELSPSEVASRTRSYRELSGAPSRSGVGPERSTLGVDKIPGIPTVEERLAGIEIVNHVEQQAVHSLRVTGELSSIDIGGSRTTLKNTSQSRSTLDVSGPSRTTLKDGSTSRVTLKDDSAVSRTTLKEPGLNRTTLKESMPSRVTLKEGASSRNTLKETSTSRKSTK